MLRVPGITATLIVGAALGCDSPQRGSHARLPGDGRTPAVVAPRATGVAPDSAEHAPCNGVRHVFFFIGDGMAEVQIHAAETYLAQLQTPDDAPGSAKANKLAMSRFPVRGSSTTYAHNRLITGSAAAGTALACGQKTNIGVISMDPDATSPCRTIAEAAKEAGKKVGIVTSVSLDHATPAVFYAHQPARAMYHEIGMQLANSDFDYFAGGGFKVPQKVDPAGQVQDVIQTARDNGFTIATTRDALQATTRGERIIAYNHTLDASMALYYEIDRPSDHISLSEFTRRGIELLEGQQGFFMMVEGGKIDWACHANDARTMLDDVLAFDRAILEAVMFYKEHPNDTLIVVTGDHETGGLSIGFSGTGYQSHHEVLAGQTMSYVEFDKLIADYAASHAGTGDIDLDMQRLILEGYGLDFAGTLTPETFDDLNEHEKGLLEDAFDRVMTGVATPTYGADPDTFLRYGPYTPLSVALTHVLHRRAGIAFTSYHHTGVPVPVLAMGQASGSFAGSYDNTDIPKRLARAMCVEL